MDTLISLAGWWFRYLFIFRQPFGQPLPFLPEALRQGPRGRHLFSLWPPYGRDSFGSSLSGNDGGKKLFLFLSEVGMFFYSSFSPFVAVEKDRWCNEQASQPWIWPCVGRNSLWCKKLVFFNCFIYCCCANTKYWIFLLVFAEGVTEHRSWKAPCPKGTFSLKSSEVI